MNPLDEKLKAVSGQIMQGVVPPVETVRALLGSYGAARRGVHVVAAIREALSKYGLKTEPDFEFAWIDGEIQYVLASAQAPTLESGTAVIDPTYRIGRLPSANRPPVRVPPDATREQAVTLMLANDFSQLPVMSGDRDVKGVVSWKTLGSRLALGRECARVRDCMEPAHVVGQDDSMFPVIDLIATHDYALVQAHDKTICGIVTASDFNDQFRILAEPFLLVGEIENGLRAILGGKFTAAELASAREGLEPTRALTAVSDMTFGEYIRLLQKEANWKKLAVRVDRAEIVRLLDRVRVIRNDIMHFDPEGLDPSELQFLRDFANFLRRLRDVGAV